MLKNKLYLLILLVVYSGQARGEQGAQAGVVRCQSLYGGVLVASGERHDYIVFSEKSYAPAKESLLSLKSEIADAVSLMPGGNSVYLVGYFTGGYVASTVVHNSPEPKKFEFCLLGWFIKTPFYCVSNTSDFSQKKSREVRWSLKKDDFDPPFKVSEFMLDKKNGLLKIGEVPLDNGNHSN